MSFGVRRRARRADQFVQIENAFLRDDTLSIEARGVGAYLLTHAEGFRLSSAFLGKATGCGRDKLRRILAELETAGYLVREQARDGGRFAEDEFSMSDEKAQVAPVTENPATENQGLETSTHKNTTSENTKDQEHQEDSCPADAGRAPAKAESKTVNKIIDAEFADWWAAYPRKVAKGQAERAYRTARKNGASQTDLLEGIRAHAAAWARRKTETQYQPYPATWLNGKRWLDDPEAIAVGGSSARGSQSGPGVVHTREERAQQEASWAAMPKATPISQQELEELFRD